jgi:hypothetical protein
MNPARREKFLLKSKERVFVPNQKTKKGGIL